MEVSPAGALSPAARWPLLPAPTPRPCHRARWLAVAAALAAILVLVSAPGLGLLHAAFTRTAAPSIPPPTVLPPPRRSQTALVAAVAPGAWAAAPSLAATMAPLADLAHHPAAVSQLPALAEGSSVLGAFQWLLALGAAALVLPVAYATLRNLNEAGEYDPEPREASTGEGLPYEVPPPATEWRAPAAPGPPSVVVSLDPAPPKAAFSPPPAPALPVRSVPAAAPKARAPSPPTRKLAPTARSVLSTLSTPGSLALAVAAPPPVPVPVRRRGVVRAELRTAVLRVAGIAFLAIADAQVARLVVFLGIPFPATVLTLAATFAALCLLDRVYPEDAARVERFFAPAVAFLTRWLAVLFVPLLCDIPTVAGALHSQDLALAVAVSALRCVVMTIGTGAVAQLLLGERPAPKGPATATAAPAPAPAAGRPVLPGPALMVTFGLGVWASVNGMAFLPQWAAAFRGLLHISTLFLAFAASLHLQRRLAQSNKVLSKLAQPVVLSGAAMLLLIQLLAFCEGVPFLAALKAFNTGVRAPYPGGAGDAVTALLPPAVVAMAFALYQRRALVFRYLLPLVAVTATHSAAALFLTAGLCRWVGLAAPLGMAVVANSASTPLAVEAARALGAGALLPLTVVAAIASGVVGGMGGFLALDIGRIRGPMSRGLAMGSNAHGLGTATAAQDEPPAAPFAALAFALVGAATAALCAVPTVRAALLVVLTP